jgi:hypothetical protein
MSINSSLPPAEQSEKRARTNPSLHPPRFKAFLENTETREKQSFNQSAGHWQAVSHMRRPWRIDQLWWRPGEAVSRRYFRVAPEDGPPLSLYQDLLTGLWFHQEY